jgi:hypothetical protein
VAGEPPVSAEAQDDRVYLVFQSASGNPATVRAVCATRARANAFVLSQSRDGVSFRIVEELFLR